MYYGQIITDPKDPNRILLGDTSRRVSEAWTTSVRWAIAPNMWTHIRFGSIQRHQFHADRLRWRHVRSFDRGANWHSKQPAHTAVLDVDVDNATPFYHVYGGTQDNWSLGVRRERAVPRASRTRTGMSLAGATGFHSRVDPEDPKPSIAIAIRRTCAI